MVGESAALNAPAAAGRLEAERLRLVCRAVVRTPIGVVPASAFIAYVMAPHIGAAHAWEWMLLVSTLWSARAVICAQLLRRPPPLERVPFWIRFQALASAASGIAAGSAGALFHAAPELESAILTMVVCGWCAAGLGVSGALPIAFYGLIGFFIPPIALGWALSGYAYGSLIAILLVLFMFLLATHARDSAQIVGQALRVGFENEALAGQLRAREAEAQAARGRAEAANLSKSAFLAAASHDLRQPLHALSLLLYTLQERTRDPEAAEILRKIAVSADSLDGLFKALLDLSRFDAGSVRPQPQPLALGPLLARLENDFRPLAGAKGLAFAAPASTAWVVSDPELLERILRNLLDNAVKYTQRGEVAIEVGESAGAIEVAVRDTGIGIDAEHRERVFEEYFQIRNPARDRRQGIGLGLALVKRMCELLGHPIALESAPARGSRFALRLPPCAAPAAPAAASRAEASPEQLRGLVVVVVEDDAEVREAMRTLLQGWGCRAVVCTSAAEAEQQLDAAGARPDAVLADYRLAGAESGIDAVARLCLRYGALPAAIVTGEINASDLEVPESLGAIVMQKPLRAADIRDWLLLLKSIA